MLTALQLGKLASRGRLNAVAPGPLVHIEDQLSKRRFLVDTGASFSIYPFSSKAAPTGPTLFGPAGKLIPCWGERSISLQFNNKKFTWTFLLAAVSFPIIGVDFLIHFKLLIDPAANRLVDTASCQAFSIVSSLAMPAATAVAAAATPLQSPVISHSHRLSASVTGHQPQSPVNSPSHRSSATVTGQPHPPPPSPGPASAAADVKLPPGLSANASSAGREAPPLLPPPPNIIVAVLPYAQLLADFPQVVNQSKVLPTPSTEVEHHISTTGPPISSKFRRLDSVKLAAAKKEFYQMEKDGIVRRSDSPWSSPLHMVMKPDGSWRPCGDYRRLNLVTTKDSYPLPNMADFAERLEGCVIFSKVDLRNGYHQIRMHAADIPKTAIITPFGLWEFLRMTFGLRNAGNTFQRYMDRVLSGLDFIFVYLDDVIIASRSEEEHLHTASWNPLPAAQRCLLGHQQREVCLRCGCCGVPRPPRVGGRNIANGCASGGHPAPSETYYSEGASGVFRHHQLLPPFCPGGGKDPETSDGCAALLTGAVHRLGVVGGHGGSIRRREGHPLQDGQPGSSLTYRRAGPHGGRLSRTCRSVPAAANGGGRAVAAARFFL